MQDKTANLETLRNKIDALDETLLTTLARRQALMCDVGARKQRQKKKLSWQPERELARLAHIAQAASKVDMPAASLLALWQTIMGAALAKQICLSMYLPRSLMSLARQQFGDRHSYEVLEAKQAIRAMARDQKAKRHNSLAILPLGARTNWWLAPLPSGLAVIAALPLWHMGTRRPRAFCVAPTQAYTHPQTQKLYVGRVKACPPTVKPLAQYGAHRLFAMLGDAPRPKAVTLLGCYVAPLQLSRSV